MSLDLVKPEAASPDQAKLTQLYVYVTDGCNCSCRHCWIIDESAAGRTHLVDVDTVDQVFAEGLPLGLESVKWTGGEPTIHPRFPDLLRLQKKHGLSGSVESNGLEITEPLALLMKECGITQVSVSLDGASPETHDDIRGVSGAHVRALRGLAALRAASLPSQIIMTLMRDNWDEVDALLDLAERAGVGSVKFNILQPTLRGERLHAEGDGVALRDLLAVRDHLERDCASRYPFSIHMDLPAAFRPLHLIFEEGPGARCGIMGILGLLADGSYALCGIGTNVPEMVFGRAGVDPLAEVWLEHPVLLQLRAGIAEQLEGICGRCLLNRFCLGSCMAQNYYRGGRLFAPFWLCEKAEAEGLFPPSRLRG